MLLLYLIPTFGVNVTVHYCCGKIASVSFGSSTQKLCACGSKKMKKNCCQNKKLSFSVKNDQLKSQVVAFASPKSIGVHDVLSHPQPFENRIYSLCLEEDFIHPPPDNLKQSLYILNKTIRI